MEWAREFIPAGRTSQALCSAGCSPRRALSAPWRTLARLPCLCFSSACSPIALEMSWQGGTPPTVRAKTDIQGPFEGHQHLPIAGRPWVPKTRPYGALAPRNRAWEPVGPPLGKSPLQMPSTLRPLGTIEGPRGVGPIGPVGWATAGPRARPYSAIPSVLDGFPLPDAHPPTWGQLRSYTGLLCGFSGSHTVVLDGRAKTPSV